MSSDAQNTASPGSLAIDSSMRIAPKLFIGAVEDEWQLYSDCASDYVIGAPIGFGASSIVYFATYYPDSTNKDNKSKGIPCALKVLDLDSLPRRSLQLLQRETTLMSLSKHPNVLRVRGSWVDGHKLYIALRLMNKGSAADVMRYGWPGGMEEDVCKCILRQALKGINYLHINGFIHRDVKAANLLIDDDGTVLLGDLGVAADLTEDTSHVNSSSSKSRIVTASVAVSPANPTTPSLASNDSGKRNVSFNGKIVAHPRIGKRKSFVGTPCWMAPELIQGRQYDAAADIWSFGITALELTQGRPPRSRESPQSVLLKTIQEEPPNLDRDGGANKYSRAFKDIVDSCLVKDPTKRPTAAELLQTPFFKSAKKKQYLINTILKDLPPLVQRQERRAISKLQSANSVDSWDFTTTINSPTLSVYRKRALEDPVVSQERGEIISLRTFEMTEDHATSSSSYHHGSVSFHEKKPPILEESEPVDIIVIPKPSTLSDSFSATSTHSTPDSSAPAASSAPSSNTEPDSISQSGDIKALVTPAMSSLTAASHEHVFERGRRTSISQSASEQIKGLSTRTPPMTLTSTNSSPAIRYSPNLWKKLKSTLKKMPLPDDSLPKQRPSQTTYAEGSASKYGASRQFFHDVGATLKRTSTRPSQPDGPATVAPSGSLKSHMNAADMNLLFIPSSSEDNPTRKEKGLIGRVPTNVPTNRGLTSARSIRSLARAATVSKE